MPWKECNIVEERLRFIARLLDGDGVNPIVCADPRCNEEGYLCSDIPADSTAVAISAVKVMRTASLAR